jgi:hypothetical protein
MKYRASDNKFSTCNAEFAHQSPLGPEIHIDGLRQVPSTAVTALSTRYYLLDAAQQQ